MASPVYDTATDQISSAGNNGIFTIGLSGGAASSGDLVMAALYIESDAAITLPTDWAEIPTNGLAEQDSGSGAFRLYVWYKVAGASEPATYDFDFAGTLWIHGAIWKVTGQHGTPFHVSAKAVSSGTDTTSEPVEVETTVTDCLLIHIAANFTGGAWTADTGDGFTERLDNSANITVASKEVTTAGLSGSIVATCAGSGTNAAILVAIQSTTSENPGPAGKILMENGTDRYLLEDGSGVLLLEGDAAGETVTPGTASLTLTAFAPTVTSTANIVVVPTTASLATARFAPTVTASDHKTVTPGIATLTLAPQAPAVSIGIRVVPGTASLTLTPRAPSVAATAHVTVVPGKASLALTAFAPTAVGGQGLTVIPGIGALSLTPFAPTVTMSNHKLVVPGIATLTITAFAPTVTVGSPPVEGDISYMLLRGVN